MDEPKRWEKGLPMMWKARRGSGRKAQAGGALRVGRPRTRTMAHEALHAALAGLTKA